MAGYTQGPPGVADPAELPLLLPNKHCSPLAEAVEGVDLEVEEEDEGTMLGVRRDSCSFRPIQVMVQGDVEALLV